MTTPRKRGARRTLPPELTQNVQLQMHPDLYRELKIIAIREGFDSVSEFLHVHLCHELNREDLLLRAPENIGSR